MTERTMVLLEGLKVGESPRWHAGTPGPRAGRP